MADSRYLLPLILVAIGALHGSAKAQGDTGQNPRQLLKTGWSIQSSAEIRERPAILSTTGFIPKGWYAASVPSTVFAALVDNNVYPDPYFGLTLASIPGANISQDFSNLPMPTDSPFRVPWWYRVEFQTPATDEGKQVWLDFEGINYRANIWINGRQIADSKEVVGAFRGFEFNISSHINAGGVNALAVEVFPPNPDDLAINWVNVNPGPPDKNMGIWHDVYITTSGPLALRHPQVISCLDVPSCANALLTVSVDVRNGSSQTVKGVLKGEIENIELRQPVELGPMESKRMVFTPERFAQLRISHPRVWWPWQMGGQNLYKLKLECEVAGTISDRQLVHFGIREVTSELTEKGDRLFRINGKKILIRGAGWWPDMLLRASPARQQAEIQYVRDMNLNALRMDGKLEDENFLNLCDRTGILLLPGWCCCDHWENWEAWKKEDYRVAAASLRDQIRRFRNHPSALTWLNGDDNPPVPEVERAYIKVLEEENWPNPYQSHSGGKPSAVTASSGYKGTREGHYGPYGYVPPNYWLLDHTHGGAWGFNTETCPGPAVPPIESLRKFLPEDKLWPVNQWWTAHSDGDWERNQLGIYAEALSARYGPATDVQEFVEKSQVMAYEGERAMFEAYGRNKYTATGILQQMLNSAWPSVVFQLYDYYLRPGGAYFGAKKACEPMHIQYSYDDKSIVVVNSTYQGFKVKAKAEVYNLDFVEKFSQEISGDFPADSSTKIMTIPELQGLTTTYFVRLTLQDEATGHVTSCNFYWLSTRPDVLDWEHSTHLNTPTLSFSDLTELKNLPAAHLNVRSRTQPKGDENVTSVTIENPTDHLAFFVHLRINQGPGGEEVLPIIWEDNYFSLIPGEMREITATYRRQDLQGAVPIVEVEGWNLQKLFL